jgi:hypothetical protein
VEFDDLSPAYAELVKGGVEEAAAFLEALRRRSPSAGSAAGGPTRASRLPSRAGLNVEGGQPAQMSIVRA